jgi:hypothetical protein
VTPAWRPRAASLWWRASWALPPLFCLIFYWYGLRCWFRQDDFAWLALSGKVHDWRSFFQAMFEPMAQGSLRPWSERAFFMAFYAVFGLNALPFRICVFATQFANLTLIRAIVERVTGSAAAGFWAAMLWIANTALIVVMTWSSAYNQAMCGFFLLLAFHFLLLYIETGQSRFNILQWAAFLFGFGALELNVVYPALAALYTLLCARSHFRRTLPLFIPAILFAALHLAVVPMSNVPPYRMRFDSSIWQTLWTYLVWARGKNHYDDPSPWLLAFWPWATFLILTGLAAFTVRQAMRRRYAAIFFLAWFVILLAPVAPLRDHISEYYLTLPSIGLAMLGGWGLARTWQSGAAWKAAGAGLLLLYLSPLPANWIETQKRYLFSQKIERVVRGVEEARRLHPGQTILLRDAGDELFWQGLLDRPFALVGVPDVYLAPDASSALTPHPELGDFHDFIMPAAATLDRFDAGRIVVYSAAGERLRNVTGFYASTAVVSLRHEQGANPP